MWGQTEEVKEAEGNNLVPGDCSYELALRGDMDPTVLVGGYRSRVILEKGGRHPLLVE